MEVAKNKDRNKGLNVNDIGIKLAVCKSLDIDANMHKLNKMPIDELLWGYDIAPNWSVALGRDKDNKLAWIDAEQYQYINDKELIMMTDGFKLESFDIISVDPEVEKMADEYFSSVGELTETIEQVLRK